MKKVLAIIRVSTLSQITESQKSELLVFLKAKGYKESDILFKEYKGASAVKANADYLGMLSDIKTILSSPDFGALACWHINRLGRQETYLIDLKNWLLMNHKQLYIKTPDLTLLKPDGTYDDAVSMIFSMYSVMTVSETKELKEKTKRGQEWARLNGQTLGGKPKAGFKIVNKKPVPDEKELSEVKTIFQVFSSGQYSLKTIKKEISERGITISPYPKLLKNPFYRDLVGPDVFDKCQEILRSHRQSQESKNISLSNKLILCPHCGHHYLFENGLYRCYGRRALKCTNNLMISADVLDTLVWDFTIYLESEYQIELTSELKKSIIENLGANKAKFVTLSNQQQTQTKKLDRAKRLFIEGDIEKTQYDKIKESVIAESDLIRARLKTISEEIDKAEWTLANFGSDSPSLKLQRVKDVLSITDPFKKRDITHKHIKSISLSRDTFEGRDSTIIKITSLSGITRELLFDYRRTRFPLSRKLYIKVNNAWLPYQLVYQKLKNLPF